MPLPAACSLLLLSLFYYMACYISIGIFAKNMACYMCILYIACYIAIEYNTFDKI